MSIRIPTLRPAIHIKGDSLVLMDGESFAEISKILLFNISTLKFPLPFKAGVNITGNLDKMKFRLGKAKYKNAITPTEVHKVDSTRMNMGNEIVNRFRRAVVRRPPK